MYSSLKNKGRRQREREREREIGRLFIAIRRKGNSQRRHQIHGKTYNLLGRYEDVFESTEKKVKASHSNIFF